MEEIIIDRTQEDVARARTYRSYLQSGSELTEGERWTLERGCVTINTLNRIERNTAELRQIATDMFYFVPSLETKDWGNQDVFRIGDFLRIINNALILRAGFLPFLSTPTSVSPVFQYTEFNKLERIIYDLNESAKYVKSNYRECGAYECGGN